jgi:hypothetical protein
MHWETHIRSRDEINPIDLAAEIIDVFHDGFGLPWRDDGWSAQQAAEMVARCTIVLTLRETHGTPLLGYACYVCSEEPVVGNLTLLWEDAVCIRKAHQQKFGWGKKALTSAHEIATSLKRTVGYVGGRTTAVQNRSRPGMRALKNEEDARGDAVSAERHPLMLS